MKEGDGKICEDDCEVRKGIELTAAVLWLFESIPWWNFLAPILSISSRSSQIGCAGEGSTADL